MQRIQETVTTASNGDVKSASEELLKLRNRVDYWTGRAAEAVMSTKRLALKDKHLDVAITELIANLESSTKAERINAEAAIRRLAKSKGWTLKPRSKRLTKLEKEAQTIIPVRKYKGPVSTHQWVRKLTPEDREAFHRFGKQHKEASGMDTLAVYWADGKRNLLEIARLVEMESGRSNLPYLVDYFGFIEKMGLVSLR